jgi:ribA/ribD-fused uncharacterized protein
MIVREFQGVFRYLSNFWPCQVEYEGEVYPSVEHAYQAAKVSKNVTTRIFVDGKIVTIRVREWIRTAAKAGEAKRMGRKVGPVGPDWEGFKLDIMLDLLRKKFQDPELKAKLLATGEVVLEEGNRWGDEFWGRNLKTGKGMNNLGVLIMRVRSELQGGK